VPYKPYPEEAPQADAPARYFEPKDVSAATFGGLIAKGVEEFGAAATRVGEQWGQTQKDQALNAAIGEGETAAEEFGKLQGADAVNAEQDYKTRVDEIGARYKSQLPAYLQNEFDVAFRPYVYRYINGKISTHALTQGQEYQKSVNTATMARAGEQAEANYADPRQFVEPDPNNPTGSARELAWSAALKHLQAAGNENDPLLHKRAIQAADDYVLSRAAEAWYVQNKAAGLDFLDHHRKEFSPAEYDKLYGKFRNGAEIAEDRATSDQIRQDIEAGKIPTVSGTEPPAGNVVPIRPGITPGVSQAAPLPYYAATTIQLESGGAAGVTAGSYRGLGQFGPQEEKRWGITNPDDPAQVSRALNMEANENRAALARVTGREPTPAEFYLAHQQGLAGAVAHLSNPERLAWRSMAQTGEGRQKGEDWAKRAIWGNMTASMKAQFPGGVDTVTSGNFVKLWDARYGQIASRVAYDEAAKNYRRAYGLYEPTQAQR
jgi:hypothetical protein